MQRITSDAEISYVITEKELNEIRADERQKTIDEYTEWLRKSHANFDEDYAEDIKSSYLEWLKEQKNECIYNKNT